MRARAGKYKLGARTGGRETQRPFKCSLLGLRQVLTVETLFKKMIQNAFYYMLKALFTL